ncbi:unnamed protein product [Pleuronectes platessa]|uniref:Uncharacterized protein n=1 Tax=Pleuronectes platessa TaxID=8262 RepID=A0A9N7VLN6_PLEPL|nr:unnamed protein product [Pleuronectes platessa]
MSWLVPFCTAEPHGKLRAMGTDRASIHGHPCVPEFLPVHSVTSLTPVFPLHRPPATAELGEHGASLRDDFNPLLSGARTLPLTRVREGSRVRVGGHVCLSGNACVGSTGTAPKSFWIVGKDAPLTFDWKRQRSLAGLWEAMVVTDVFVVSLVFAKVAPERHTSAHAERLLRTALATNQHTSVSIRGGDAPSPAPVLSRKQTRRFIQGRGGCYHIAHPQAGFVTTHLEHAVAPPVERRGGFRLQETNSAQWTDGVTVLS